MSAADGYESMNDALIGAVKALGGSKQVGPLLWPDLEPDAAQRRLLDALNPDRPAHLTPGQMLVVMRKARQRGNHDAIQWILARLGYAPTHAVDPRDEVADLQRKFIEASDQIATLGEQIMRLQAVVPVQGWVEDRAAVRAVG